MLIEIVKEGTSAVQSAVVALEKLCSHSSGRSSYLEHAFHKQGKHLARLQSYHVSQHMPRLCIICLGWEAVEWTINFARLLQAGRPVAQAGF